MVRILLRPHRQPASRIAWVAVVGALPGIGVVAYLFLGETNIGRRNFKAMREAFGQLPAPPALDMDKAMHLEEQLPSRYAPLFKVGYSISRFEPVAGNNAVLMADSNATIDHMVKDIDAATDQVNVLFYIWLTDNNGSKMAGALKRAAARGVTCRAMVDGLGSRTLLKSKLWREMWICAITAKFSLSTAVSPIAAARIAPTLSFRSRQNTHPGSIRSYAWRGLLCGKTSVCSPATG